jgi:putative two-component system response regulator
MADSEHTTVDQRPDRRADSRLLPPLGLDALYSSTGRDVVLLVDSEDINRHLLKGILKAAPYRILETRGPSEALQLLERDPVDLIVADLMMPGMGGLEFCRRVKASRRTRLIPLLIITSLHGVENEVAGLESGADEFLTRPLQPTVVRTRVRAMLRNKHTIDSLEEAETILFALAQTVEERDQETGNHCHRLANLSMALGLALGLPEDDITALYRGGFLHDIGKIAVPDAILNKGGQLTVEEWEVMRSHTVRGEAICQPMKSLAPVLPIIRNHHERWDGSGYPDGLASEAIPLLARILQLADIYDALTSRRSYKEPFSSAEAVEILRREASNGWRDPELVSVFCAMVQQPGFAANPGDLFGVPSSDTESATLDSMRASLERMSREVMK